MPDDPMYDPAFDAEDPSEVQQVPPEDYTQDPVPVSPTDPAYDGMSDQYSLEGLEPYTPEELDSFSTCCYEGLPQDWTSWEPPVEPSPESWTDWGCSTDWGYVEPDWAQQGEELFTVTQPEQPISELVGPGHEADIYWGYQGQTNYCALYSVRSVLSELYGTPVDINEIIATAERGNWLVRDEQGVVKGVYAEHFDDLLAAYGVGSHNYTGEAGAWQALNDALANDERVVLALDSKEIDAGGNVGDVPGALDSDHAVAVTGIDYARGVVIMNDSARGAGLEIPIEQFYESWRDSDFAMTVTDTSTPAAAAAQPPAGLSGPRPDAPGFAMLGMTLTPSLRTA